MMFIYNETRLELIMKSYTEGNVTKLVMQENNNPKRESLIAKCSDERVSKAINARYENGVQLLSPLSKEYVMIKGLRILMDPETDTIVNMGQIDSNENEKTNKTVVKNMIVLILHKESKFFIKLKNLSKRANIQNFGDEYKLVTMYIKTNNWNFAREPMNILIQSGLGYEYDVNLDLVSEKGKDSKGEQYVHNAIKVSQYVGQFPSFTPKKKPDNANNKKPYRKNDGGKTNYNGRRDNGHRAANTSKPNNSRGR